MTLKLNNLKLNINSVVIHTNQIREKNEFFFKIKRINKNKFNYSLNQLIILEKLIDFSKEFRLPFLVIFGLSFKKCEQFHKLFGTNLIRAFLLKDILHFDFNILNSYIPLINLCGLKLINILIQKKKNI